MAFCRSCGQEIADNAVFCTNCGAQQTPENNTNTTTTTPEIQDKGGFLWGLLGCCVPVAGLILYLLWKDTKPKTAKAAGIGALVYAGCFVVYLIVVFIFSFIVGMTEAGMTF